MPSVRAVAYYRKSNEDDGSSIEQQRAWVVPVCQKEGIELVREFADQSKAGWDTRKRTAFHEMLAFCQAEARAGRPIRAVVCWHPNRFSRADSLETGKFLYDFREAGVSRMYTSARGWIDFARSEDRMLFGIEQETGAHSEVKKLAKESTRGRKDAAEAGRWAGGSIPLGYRAEREEVIVNGQRRMRPVRLVLGPNGEVETVRLIFHLYANTPGGLRAIAEELTRRRIPTPKGLAVWTTETVKGILTNPVYLGRIVWNRRSVGQFACVIDGKPVERAADCGKARANPKEQWIGRDGRHEPVIDLATYERCQEKLAGRGGRRRARGTYILTGLLRCAHCGRAMVGRTEFRGRRVYFCGGYTSCGTVLCHYNALDADQLAEALLGKLRAAWVDEANVEAIVAEVTRQEAAEGEAGGRTAETLRRRIRQLDADLTEGMARLRAIDLSLIEGYQEGLKGLQAERQQAGAELARLESEPAPAADLRRRVEGALAVLRRLDLATAQQEPDLLRELLAEVVAKVEVWFSHEQQGKRVRCRFAKALIWLREDVALFYTRYTSADGCCNVNAMDGRSRPTSPS